MLVATRRARTTAAGQSDTHDYMRHIIAILLQNEAGALSRVAGLFSSRGYNIESLNVAPTEDPAVSRLTLVTKGSEGVIHQIASQLLKLVDVVNVEDMTRGEHVERELLILKLRVAGAQQAGLREMVAQAGGKVLAETADCHIVELTHSEAQVSAFIASAARGGEIIEVVRSGALGVTRGAQSLQAAALER
ncbi:MAG TPA: acetolactate synthase small subunit [Steroidobacteraceae bacterium]|nr:acetolactate synthase small subunit [Steroidobacteraceae bacterium]